MPPRGRKHWCKQCMKCFPSGMSLGGHMALHRGWRKKQPSSPSIGAGRYGLQERHRGTWWLSDYISSDDDEPWTLVPKTECQHCFKVFASCDALSLHMRAHSHHEKKKMLLEHKASGKIAALSNGDGDHNVTVSAAPGMKRSRRMVLDTVSVSTPVMMTYGIQEVDAARILLMLSVDHDMYSASVDCNEDCEMDGNLAYHTMTEIELNSSDHGLIGDNELMEPEYSSSYEEMKFCSLSDVLNATTGHECKVCGKVFTSGQALGGHKKSHNFVDRDRVSTTPKSAVTQPSKQLLEMDRELLVLSLPAPNNWRYSSMRHETKV